MESLLCYLYAKRQTYAASVFIDQYDHANDKNSWKENLIVYYVRCIIKSAKHTKNQIGKKEQVNMIKHYS